MKEHNVECCFEKEGLWTFDSKSETILAIMSSLAQEESRSISENVTWGTLVDCITVNGDGTTAVPFRDESKM